MCNNLKRVFLAVVAGLILYCPASGWGREGHETIAKIAENHLRPSARRKIEKYLGNRSIVYYAKWMDDYRRTPEYKFTNYWHQAPVNEELEYADSLLHPTRWNAVHALEQAIAALEDYKELPDSAVAVNLKYIIHIVGDMHCPAHVTYTTYNQRYDVYMPGSDNPVYVHHIWDTHIIRATRWFSATEWAAEIDRISRKEAAGLVSGTPRDWFDDTAERCVVQFEWAKPGQRLDQDFLNKAIPLIETQLLYAGYRLASLLNELF